MTHLNRRTFLLGAAGVAGASTFLVACSDDSTNNAVDPTATPPPLATPLLVPAFPDGGRVPAALVHSVEQRVAYVLHDGNDIVRENAPDNIDLELRFGGEVLAKDILQRRDQGENMSTPYFSTFFTPPQAGVYTSVMTKNGETSTHEFVVLEPGETPIPQPGDRLPDIATPITGDLMGIDPLCTRPGQPCPFHAISLDAALIAADKPIVLSIATPGFCQTAICGPVIEFLIERAGNRDDLHVIHAEVFLDPHNDPGAFDGTAVQTPIVEAFELPFEPVLLLAAPDGTILRRLEMIYDGSELAEALALV
jgi:hypothetical protein